MHSVLIADDEYLVLEGLRIMIDWEKYGFEIVAQAQSAEEAIEKYKQYSPDLIVTDIYMGNIDGLEFIERIKGMGYDGEIIILTGYSRLELARGAMKQGVRYFSIKPIDKEEIEGFLKEIASQLAARRKTESIMNDPAVADAIKRGELIRGSDDGSGYTQWGIVSFVGGDIRLDGINCSNEITLYECAPNMLSFVIRTNDDFDAVSNEFFREVVKLYPHARGYRIKGREEKLEECLDRLLKGLRRVRGAKDGNLYDIADIKTEPIEPAQIGAYIDRIAEFVEICDTDGAKGVIEEFFTRLETDINPINSMMIFYVYLIVNINRIVLKVSGSPIETNDKYIINGYTPPDEAREAFIQICRDTVSHIHRVKNERDKDTFAIVEEYIREHYKEQIVIKDLAKKLYTSPGYLGTVFMKKSGVGIKEYIHSLRMQEVVRLMTETDMTMNEISLDVGYNSYNIFYNRFKRIFGMSPNEYRSMYVK